METSVRLGGVVLVLLAAIATAWPQSLVGDPGKAKIVRTCDDLPQDRLFAPGLAGVYRFESAIHCTRPKIVRCKEDATIFTMDNADLDTTNVHFFVHQEAVLTMLANTVNVKTNENATYREPLFIVAGLVDIVVTGWTPPHENGTLEDLAGVTRMMRSGSLHSHGDIRFTDDSVVVASEESVHDYKKKHRDMMERIARNHDDKALADLRGKLPQDSSHVPVSPIPWTPRVDDALRMGVKLVRSASSLRSRLHDSVISPRRTLKCGEMLKGKLVSDRRTAALWQGAEGSVMHGIISDGTLGDKKKEIVEPVTLIESNERKVLRVWRERQACDERKMGEGRSGPTKKDNGFFRWVPWGRRGPEKDTAGQTGITLDNRGCVHSTMDGVVVLSKCGKHKWNWLNNFPWRRKKSEDYELRVSPGGIEVRRGDEHVWGVPAKGKK